MQRLTNSFLIILAFALPCIQTNPGVTDSVNIIKKFTQDLHSSPSGYTFHHRSGSVHPGGYDADVNHGEGKIAGQLRMEKLTAEMNGHEKSGTYRLAGGYGFVISHDYGSQRSHTEAPYPDVDFGASNADHASIAVLQLDRKDTGGPGANVDEKSGSVMEEKNEGLDSYIGKEIYGSYMEYDKLVKDGKKEPSVHPGEYYESDVHGGKEKYDSDDGYGESNNGRDKGRRLKSEKYHESEGYNENEHYGALRGHGDYVDDGEAEKYVTYGGYGQLDDLNAKDKAGLYEGYGENENNHETYVPFETNDQFTASNGHYESSSTNEGFDGYKTEPKFKAFRDSFLDDFFKEYNEFSKGANIQAGFKYDHLHDRDDDYYGDHGFKHDHVNDRDDDYYGDHGFKHDHVHDDHYYGDHGFEDEHSLYAEDGHSGKDFFDESDSGGDHHEEGRGEKNSKFGEKKGHKSGSKTTGFRNVFHKDDYKKDHTFYEHAKNNGHFNKDENYDEHEHQEEGGHKKGGHHDSSSIEDHSGKKDSEDKGYSLHDDLSDHNEHGYKTYFDDNSEYSEGGAGQYGSEYEMSYDH